MAAMTAHAFLNSVLSQRGPSALPYEEEMKVYIRQHLVALDQEFSSLHAKRATFTHNDGTVVNLLQAEGTIPMYYQDVMYNIPLTIWLLESYPRTPPRVFVTPTRDMIIKRHHRCVDASGLVSVPYLQNWYFPRSNLLELARNLSLIFGQDPPLYSKPTAPPPVRSSPPRNPYQSMSPLHGGGVLMNHPASSSALRPAATRPLSPYAQLPPSPQGSNGTENPSEVFKRNAINALVERLQRDVVEIRKSRETEMDRLVNVQALLRQREDQLNKGIQELHHEKEGLEQRLQVILTNTDVLETWLKNNDPGSLDVDIDNAFEPVDALSKQMLECSAADLAIEDILYSFDKAVQEGTIPVDAYLKHVRNISREQFFHRAIAVKVRAVQFQSQVANMAVRVAPYVS